LLTLNTGDHPHFFIIQLHLHSLTSLVKKSCTKIIPALPAPARKPGGFAATLPAGKCPTKPATYSIHHPTTQALTYFPKQTLAVIRVVQSWRALDSLCSHAIRLFLPSVS
jgi:hypothetical protein